jgi:hypothetical protein
LYGLPENRCPECGRAFDPADPSTFKLDRPTKTSLVGYFVTPPPAWIPLAGYILIALLALLILLLIL